MKANWDFYLFSENLCSEDLILVFLSKPKPKNVASIGLKPFESFFQSLIVAYFEAIKQSYAYEGPRVTILSFNSVDSRKQLVNPWETRRVQFISLGYFPVGVGIFLRNGQGSRVPFRVSNG